jgi:hypothetical protein
MGYDCTISRQFGFAGKSFVDSNSLTAPHVSSVAEAIPIAQAGVLTVRTDANTGSLTMDSVSHGISTGNKIDLYWTNLDGTNGQRRNVTVGTVAGAVVPIDLGAGDDLPIATTVIQAAVVQVFTFDVIGDNLLLLLATLTARSAKATIVLLDTSGTVEKLYIPIRVAGAYDWTQEGDNPLAGITIDTVHMTHNDTVNVQEMVVSAGLTI